MQRICKFEESPEWFHIAVYENTALDANKTITITSLDGLCVERDFQRWDKNIA